MNGTTPAKTERNAQIVAERARGVKLVTIADQHCISQPRVRQILARAKRNERA